MLMMTMPESSDSEPLSDPAASFTGSISVRVVVVGSDGSDGERLSSVANEAELIAPGSNDVKLRHSDPGVLIAS